MGFSQFAPLHIYLKAPIERVIKNGYARSGTVRRELSEEDVGAVPSDLRDELIELVKRTRDREEGDDLPSLELDVPDDGIENIVEALRREQSAKRNLAAKAWLAKSDDAWLDFDPWPIGDPIVEEVREYADIPAVAARIEKLTDSAGERLAKHEAALEGLREYARTLPDYRRAAADRYDVSDAAVDAYAREIAAFDEDALVFRVDHEEFKRSQLRERKAPAQYAFEVLDGVSAHLKAVESPKGLAARIGRIQRFRKAVREGAKWKLTVPVTVVPVWIDPYVTPSRVILFFADAEEKNKYVRETTKSPYDDEDIPF